MITQNEKEGIITEYLTSEISYRVLGKKYGIDFRTLHQWVQNYQGKMRNRKNDTKAAPLPESQEQLPTDVKKLQEELRKARLLNEVLTEVINIAEEELNLPIRKKYGTRQS
jgi:transposase-like protein